MVKSLYNGATGVKTFQVGMDVVANNISNMNNVAYKSKSAKFSNIFSQVLQDATASVEAQSGGSENPKQVGLGVKVASTSRNITTPGAVETTEYG